MSKPFITVNKPSPKWEIQNQRKGILSGKWVPNPPDTEGEYCLVARCVNVQVDMGGQEVWLEYMSAEAEEIIGRAIYELYGESGYCHTPWVWNDTRCESEQMALEVLEYAEKLALLEEESA